MNNYERLENEDKIKTLVYNLCTSTPKEVKIMYKIPEDLSIQDWLREPCPESYVKLSDVIDIIEHFTDGEKRAMAIVKAHLLKHKEIYE